MFARVIDEFQVLREYRVMVLDRDVDTSEVYRIDGELYTSVRLGATTVPIPRNYIAVKARRSFKGSAVELM